MNKALFSVILFLFVAVTYFDVHSQPVDAKREASRALVHTLNYIGTDYRNGVTDGKVSNQSEYTEMLGFCTSALRYYHENLLNWAAADTARIGTLIYRVDSLVHVKAPAINVAVAANNAKAEVINASHLTVAPTKYPSMVNGKVVYTAQCAKCHGATGLGDGKDGTLLNPKPRNFHDMDRMALLSPFAIYNTVRCGVQGTGMVAHPNLSDEEVWDVAFYVLTLRYKQPGADKAQAEHLIKSRFSDIALTKVATMSDKELTEAYHASAYDLSILRYHQADESKGQFIDMALKYIDESMAACREGNYEESERLSSLAYLEGIEPIENQLRSKDPALMVRLEEQMANTRKTISEHTSMTAVNDSLKGSKELIIQAGKTISKGDMSYGLVILMSISILLREGLEAFLVIMVILGIINASGIASTKKFVHAGWIMAVGSGIVMWKIGGQIIQAHMAQVELMEGFISIVAVFMLLYIGFWLHGRSEASKWKAYVTEKVKNVTGTNSMIGLFLLSFFVVFREVFESVLFLSAIDIESSGHQQNAIILGVVIAFTIVIALAWVVLRFSARLPIPKLFKISSIVMGALAVILAGKGVHSFQETNHISIHGLAFLPRVPLMELLGIFPTMETLIAQVLILGVVIYVMKYVNGAKTA